MSGKGGDRGGWDGNGVFFFQEFLFVAKVAIIPRKI
jgi:hypothetical protein